MLLGNGHEHVDDLGVKLAAGAAFDFFTGVGHRQSSTVGAVADHGVERIRNRKNASTERNLFALQAAGIARAVKKLLVCQDDFSGVAQKRDANQHVVADLAVFAHFLFFRVIEGAGFTQNAVGDGHFADVVEESGARQYR